MRNLILLFLVINIIACSDYNPNKPTTFCKIKGREVSYIVNNPPDDTLLLKKEIEKFIFKPQYLDSLKKNKEIGFVFYKGDKYLTCDFKEGEPYKIVPWHITLDSIQDLRYHTQIARIEWYRGYDTWRYNYWLRSSDEFDLVKNSKRLKIKNIDSLFLAKQKEYGIK